MKILFLDIDGVLNTGNGGLHPDKLGLLRRIIIHTECKVVLSSTWRQHSYDRIKEELLIYDVTPDLTKVGEATGLVVDGDREEEIHQWIKSKQSDNPTTHLKFCILDDSSKFNLYKSKLVKTEREVGLTTELAGKVIKILS